MFPISASFQLFPSHALPALEILNLVSESAVRFGTEREFTAGWKAFLSKPLPGPGNKVTGLQICSLMGDIRHPSGSFVQYGYLKLYTILPVYLCGAEVSYCPLYDMVIK